MRNISNNFDTFAAQFQSMKKLKVNVCKAGKGVSANLPEVPGYVIARSSVGQLKKELRAGLTFHIEGLYEEEREDWMKEDFEFEYEPFTPNRVSNPVRGELCLRNNITTNKYK
ncbi:hypothetical protein Barb6_01511 [Bacteroidales bacterium Barb6]|nr:hypothetical protein Barb6XT_01819 [Bacteroidales bacterium Barb6XT]OAV71138.1 hypothetical protein Barb6_01511 [Bacteroidales bacterium Barb6]